jgi:hypothetical protein
MRVRFGRDRRGQQALAPNNARQRSDEGIVSEDLIIAHADRLGGHGGEMIGESAAPGLLVAVTGLLNGGQGYAEAERDLR